MKSSGAYNLHEILWRGGVVLPENSESCDCIVSDAMHQKRFRVTRDMLLQYFTTKTALQCEDFAMQEKFETALHWVDRGWEESLEYYLWSQDGQYADNFDPDARVRTRILNGYLKTESIPQRLEKEEELLKLSEAAPLSSNECLSDLMRRRLTERRFKKNPLPESMFSAILWHSLDAVRANRKAEKRTVVDYLHSYGAAFDFYVVVYHVADISPGVYRYDVKKHALVNVSYGNYRDLMGDVIANVNEQQSAAFTVILVNDFEQYQWRYRHERALRHLYFEAGRIAHRLILTALAENVGCMMTPAFKDEQLGEICEIDTSKQSPVYSLTMGLQVGSCANEQSAS